MKKFFFLAIAATALASCSSDELVELKEGDEIKITAVADNDSRAAEIFCNNNKMDEFNLYAAVGEKTFIGGEVYTNTDGVYSTTAKRYWPEYDAVDFYALHNQGSFTWAPAGTDVATGSFTPETSVLAQKDFVYAVKKGVVKPADGHVALNFRHALSQIEFQAKNLNTNLKIEILDVKVGNALSTATYTLPASTDGNVIDHNQDGVLEEDTSLPASAVIEWSAWTAGGSNTSYTFGATEFGAAKILEDTEGTLTLSTPETDYAKSMLLLPQTTTAWAADATTGTYLAVKVRIWNKSGGDETLIYGDANTDEDGYEGRWAFVPVAFNWKPGYKYVYTFNFTNGGNAGYEDTDNNGEPDNKPVLVPLTVDVTVDDFVEAAGQPVDTPMVK